MTVKPWIIRLHNHINARYKTIHDETQKSLSANVGRVSFDSLTGALRHGNATHSFQRGDKGDELRIRFFRLLWENKSVEKKGKSKSAGKAFPPEYYAVQLDLADDAQKFKHNEEAKEKLSGLIKGINRILRAKGFPMSIKRQGGIQLIVAET